MGISLDMPKSRDKGYRFYYQPHIIRFVDSKNAKFLEITLKMIPKDHLNVSFLISSDGYHDT